MLFLKFLIESIIVIILSLYIARNIDIIEDNSNINGPILGLILAGAASLPELVSGLTTIHLGDTTLATSILFGANIFNIAFLLFINIIYFKKYIFKHVSKKTINFIILAVTMNLIFIIAFLINKNLNIPQIHIAYSTVLIIILYIVSVIKSKDKEDIDIIKETEKDSKKLEKSLKYFVILIVLIVLASIILAHTAEAMVEYYGLSSGAVGALLIGISAALPNVISCLGLINIGKYDTAVASIIGSNTFNFLSFCIFDFVVKKPIYNGLEASTVTLAFAGIVMLGIVFLAYLVRNKNRLFYLLPSIVGILVYAGFSFSLF